MLPIDVCAYIHPCALIVTVYLPIIVVFYLNLQKIADLQAKLRRKFSAGAEHGFRVSFKLPSGSTVNFVFKENATIKVCTGFVYASSTGLCMHPAN